MSLAKKRLLIFLLPLVLAAPFLNRAFFVDDAFFVHIAEWIKDHPGRPYDFPEAGAPAVSGPTRLDRSLRIINPLLHHYYLAAWLGVAGPPANDSTSQHLGGWRAGPQESVLRFGTTLLACFGLLFVFELARRWTKHAFMAAVLCALTPAYMLTSYSLLIDSTLGFFVFGGLYFFVRARETHKELNTAISGVFFAAGMLTKYTAVLLGPLVVLIWFFSPHRRKNAWSLVVVLGVPLLAAVGYGAWTRSMYGQAHVWASSGQALALGSFSKLLALLVFLAGSTLVPLLAWGVADRTARGVAGLCGVGVMCVLASNIGGFPFVTSAFFSVWLVSGGLFGWLVVAQRRAWTSIGDRILVAWLMFYGGMMMVVMPWLAARYVVIAVPAVVMMTVRLCEQRWPRRAATLLAWTALPVALVSFGVAYADYQQAESSRWIAKRLPPRESGDYFFAESFSMDYLLRAGWKAWNTEMPLKPGDRVVVPTVTLPLHRFKPGPASMHVEEVHNRPTRFPIKVMDSAGGGGFYASIWGPLPFSLSREPWERFVVFRVDSDSAVSAGPSRK